MGDTEPKWATPAPLLTWNGSLNLSDAYAWNREKIYEFLHGVVNDDKKKYRDDKDRKLCSDGKLRSIYDRMLLLSLPEGEHYIGNRNESPNPLDPAQHIYRNGRPGWETNDDNQNTDTDGWWDGSEELSKFTVGKDFFYEDRYWSPYDLLGLLMSAVQRAPSGANMENFYLPLTAVYARWCVEIAGKFRGGVSNPPFMFQCTWVGNDDNPGEQAIFSLGASLEGYAWGKRETGNWEMVLKKARYDLVKDVVKLMGTDNAERDENRNPKSYGFHHSPKRRHKNVQGTRFGNCAETYPLLRLKRLKGKNKAEGEYHGFALMKGNYLPGIPNQQDQGLLPSGYSYANIRWRVINPCQNCMLLIHSMGGNPANFKCALGDEETKEAQAQAQAEGQAQQ